MISIKTENLTKKYGETVAVNNLNLEIREGELFALLGVNGAGKTTTVKMLSTLVKPTGGNAFVCGKSVITEADEVKKLVDVSMQETAVAGKLTVRENLEFYAGLCGQDKARIAENVKKIYGQFGFESVGNKRADRLSGGWQRRLSIALSVIADPKVVFLDEPTLGLDVLARRELWEVINGMKAEKTIILTTHYMEEAEMLADRIGIMSSGRLLFTGSKEELYARTGKTGVEDAFIDIVSEGKTVSGGKSYVR